jgi:hypothetical protein
MTSQVSPVAVDAPVAAWDGPSLLAAITAATEWLVANKDGINALNVFPVPDGDTGTNMSLTMRAAIEAANTAVEPTKAGVGGVAADIATGSLMGARGNSGVILSQMFHGFAKAVVDYREIDGRALAAALQGASDMSYKAVMRPVEGTMLTVIRVAAERAEAAARRSSALADVLRAARDGAREALATTPALLDILRQAGVVDAGGQGVVYILDAMERFARGEPNAVMTVANGTLEAGDDMAFLDHLDELHVGDDFGYCTNFMVFGEGLDFDRCRTEIAAMGESAVIVGDDRMLKVHIHVLNPGAVLDYAVKLGELGQIKIDNMRLQARALELDRAERSRTRSMTLPDLPPSIEPEPIGLQAVLAVATGDGLVAALRSMGANAFVSGGQTMNPSIEELLAAVEAATVDDVILLPNNSNILLTANHVPALSTKRVRIVPTRSIPQALAALGAYNADADLETNHGRMSSAMSGVRTVEVTCAVRDAAINGVDVRAQQALGLLDGAIVASGEDEVEVACATLTAADLDAAELVTIFTGDGAASAQTEQLRAELERHHPDIEIQIHNGGQPHYMYVMAVE